MSSDMPPYADALLHGLLEEMERVHWNIKQEIWKYSAPFDLVPGLTYNPYYGGDCTCGFHEIDEQWSGEHHHTATCFHTRYRAERGSEAHMIAWAKANGYADAPRGMAAYCDCGCSNAYRVWLESHDHDPACPIIQPNFAFEGVEIEWYKHPHRGTSVNKSLAPDEWAAWYDRCYAAIKKVDRDFRDNRGRPRSCLRSTDDPYDTLFTYTIIGCM